MIHPISSMTTGDVIFHLALPLSPFPNLSQFRDLVCRYGLNVRDCLRRQVSQELQRTPVHGLARESRQSVLHIGLSQSSIDDMQYHVARSTIPAPICRCSIHTSDVARKHEKLCSCHALDTQGAAAGGAACQVACI